MMTCSVTTNATMLPTITTVLERQRPWNASATPNPTPISATSSLASSATTRQRIIGPVRRVARKYNAKPSGATASVISWKSYSAMNESGALSRYAATHTRRCSLVGRKRRARR